MKCAAGGENVTMHRLQDVAAKLPGAAVGKWNGIPLSCHVASLIWLHHAQTGALPAGPLAIPKLEHFRAIMLQIAAAGTPLQALFGQVVEVPVGSIVVFTGDAGNPDHSCTATSGTILIGYNQTEWFSSPGVAADFSVHYTSELQWVRPPVPASRVIGPRNRIYTLTATDGAQATRIYRDYA
jgi:hypothetical protein